MSDPGVLSLEMEDVSNGTGWDGTAELECVTGGVVDKHTKLRQTC